MSVELVLDFDRTIADMFVPSPGGVTVPSAYEGAVRDVFGSEALELYRKQGGLNNDGPTEVAMRLRPDLSGDELIAAAEDLVQAKISYYLPEIGRPMEEGGIWPPLCTGFAAFWRQVKHPRDYLQTAVVSSGHTAIIEHVFEVHGLIRPNVIVSDDDMRRRSDVPAAERSKPHPRIMWMAQERLLLPDLSRVIYLGDDEIKDGGLAHNAGVRFGHFDPRAGGFAYTPTGFRFSDWTQLLPLVRHWQVHDQSD